MASDGRYFAQDTFSKGATVFQTTPLADDTPPSNQAIGAVGEIADLGATHDSAVLQTDTFSNHAPSTNSNIGTDRTLLADLDIICQQHIALKSIPVGQIVLCTEADAFEVKWKAYSKDIHIPAQSIDL